MTSDPFTSGKGSGDENFPVASVLIAPRHRPLVMAFYRVARMADDVADHPTTSAADKLARLDAIEAGLVGASDAVPEAAALRQALAARGLDAGHARDLLRAFRLDVGKTRYADWDDLMDYCRWSAAPVGRFMLDLHGESREAWPASDALCAALQVINHLQDCGKDYRELDRVYLPLDGLADVGSLGEARASPDLRAAIMALAGRTDALLARSALFSGQVRDLRLGLEIAVIHKLAVGLNDRLKTRDPLSQRVHHRPLEALWTAVTGGGGLIATRLGLGRRPALGHS